jgi:hypothetical protein
LFSAEAASWAVGASPLQVWALPVAAPEGVLQRGAAAREAARRRDAAAVSLRQLGGPVTASQRRLWVEQQ